MHQILVVDDEPDVRDAIKRILERAGYSVRVTSDGSGVLEELRAVPAEVVIADIIMPKTNGVEAIQAIRTEFPDAKIIAISGGGNFAISGYQPAAITTSAYLMAARRAGADHVMTKPFDAQELLLAIAHVLRVGHA
jgi:two-component system, chemotaxis family, chemotaxis protein CheY